MTQETQAHEEVTYIFGNRDIQNTNYHQTNQSEQYLSTEGDLALRGHLAISGGISAYHNWYSVAHLVVKARDTAEHITRHRISPMAKNYMAPDFNSSRIEKP